MTTLLITGTNRGIGLEMVRQYAQQSDNRIFATARQTSPELTALIDQHPAQITFIPLEVTDQAQIENVVAEISRATSSLDILINNAGMRPDKQTRDLLPTVTPESMLEAFTTNSIAPLMITRSLLPLLQKAPQPRVINVSTQVGSMQWKVGGGSYGYASSKAALNMVTRCLAADLREMNIMVITLHPGWVQTDMGGEEAPLTPQESVAQIINLVGHLTLEDSGKFYKWNGEIHPW